MSEILPAMKLEEVVNKFSEVRITKHIISPGEGGVITVVYAFTDDWQTFHRALIGIVRGEFVKPMILVEAREIINIPSTDKRVKLWIEGEWLRGFGIGSNAGNMVLEAGAVRLDPMIVDLIAFAPWDCTPPSSFPAPAMLLGMLLREYVRIMVLDEWDERVVTTLKHMLHHLYSKKVLWESRNNIVENPLYYAAKALVLAENMMRQ